MISTPSFPQRVEIELSSACNLNCTYCPRQYLPQMGQFIDIDLFARIIQEIKPYPSAILTLHRRGESLLHPNLNKIMQMVAGKFSAVQLATNGSLLTSEKFAPLVHGLTFLSFSLDVPETFNATRRGANYSTVETNILTFIDYNNKQENRVTTQASMVRVETTTDEQCERFMQIWKERVDRVRIYEEHSKDGVFGAMTNFRIERKPCTMPFYEILVYADGSVGRCNHDWDGPRLGDLTKQSINEVWHSPLLNDLRKQHLTLKIIDPVCATCSSWYPETGIQGTGSVLEGNTRS